MQYRRLGSSGLQLSVLSCGTMSFHQKCDQAEAEAILKTAYDAGVNFIDNAEGYSNGHAEEMVGRAIRKFGWRRDSFCLSSKAFWGVVKDAGPNQRGLCRKHLREACDQALARYDVEYLDLYFAWRPDPEVPVEEVVRTMNQLIDAGKVLYWGTSFWKADAIMEAVAVARRLNLVPPCVEQSSYSLLGRWWIETEFAGLYDEAGLGVTGFGALHEGWLTGKYVGLTEGARKDFDEKQQAQYARVQKLDALAKNHDMSLSHLALGWTLQNPRISTMILGTSRAQQMADNLGCLEHLEGFNDDLMKAIDATVAEA